VGTSFAPERSLSQNFLTDQKISRKIVMALGNIEGNIVLEIGPGTGALTKFLLQTSLLKLYCAELDDRSIEFIAEQPWAKDPRLVVMKKDVLEIKLQDYASSEPAAELVVIGNIPYSITSPILFWLFSQRHVVSKAVIMMQREVAERCVAAGGSKEYGILSCATSFVSKAKIVMHVKAGSFFPKPKVSSSVVQFDFARDLMSNIEFEENMKFVQAAFSQRRKVLSNSLQTWFSSRYGKDVKSINHLLPFDLQRTRAEQLSPSQLQLLLHEIKIRAVV